TVYGEQPHPHAAYLPPELRNLEDYDVFDNSDLFSLARVVREVLGDGIPAELAPLLDRCERDDPSERPDNPAAFLEELDAILGSMPVAHEEDATLERPPTEVTETVEYDALEPGQVIDGVNEVLGCLG